MKDRFSVCRLILQRKPKLDRTKPLTRLHAASRLDVADLDLEMQMQ